MADGKRMAGDYEIINAVHMGDKEIVLGVNMNASDGYFYLVSDYERNELFEKYDNGMVSNAYIEVAQIFTDRLKEQIEKVKAATKNIPRGIITANMCENISDKNLENEIIVIKADVLYPEHQTQANQIVRCTGGNGARPDSLGTAVVCTHLSNDERTRFERYDVQGILKKECYPEWLTKRLELEKANTKPKKNKDMER